MLQKLRIPTAPRFMQREQSNPHRGPGDREGALATKQPAVFSEKEVRAGGETEERAQT